MFRNFLGHLVVVGSADRGCDSKPCRKTNTALCEIVTIGGVASTFRDAHVREFDAILLEDRCAAFSPAIHITFVEALRPVGRVATIADILAEMGNE